MNKFKEMFRYGNFQKRIVIGTLEYAISIILWVIINQYMTYSLFDNAISKENIQLVILLAILIMVKIIGEMLEGIFHCIQRHHLQRDFSHYARNDIFNKLINSKIEFFDKSNTGELFELAMNDSDNYSTFFTQNGLQLMSFILKIATYIVILLFMNVKLSLLLIGTYIIGYMAVIISNKKTFSLINEIRKLNISITKWITEQINGLEIIKSLKVEENRLNKMNKLIDDYNKESYKLDKIVRKYIFIYDIFSLLSILLVSYVGGLDILTGAITYGSLMIFVEDISSIKKYGDYRNKICR